MYYCLRKVDVSAVTYRVARNGKSMAKIKPIRRPSMGEMVCEQMKEYLLDGRWKAGDKIPSENELAQSFGVSRVTIREALLRLTSVGLLESRFAGANYVREITPGLNMAALVPAAYIDAKSYLEVIEFRQVVEAKTAGLAARRGDKRDVAELEEILERMHKYKDDPARFTAEDLEFHITLSRMSGNSLFIESMKAIQGVLESAIFRTVEAQGNREALMYHRAIIDAVASRDEKSAMRLTEEHVGDVYNRMEATLRNEKDKEESS